MTPVFFHPSQACEDPPKHGDVEARQEESEQAKEKDDQDLRKVTPFHHQDHLSANAQAMSKNCRPRWAIPLQVLP